ncbi:MAG: hypothetical protein KKD28_05230 [Chloroflexi bacterium]|nr:hypothetical protein [Chloroflexota bacterium]
MPTTISDSSTLIHLTAIGRLGLLKDYYKSITVPTAVWREVVEDGEGRSGALEIEQAIEDGWIEVIEPEDKAVLRLLKQELHDGEAEVIALALEEQADLIFLDESDARKVAQLYQCNRSAPPAPQLWGEPVFAQSNPGETHVAPPRIGGQGGAEWLPINCLRLG